MMEVRRYKLDELKAVLKVDSKFLFKVTEDLTLIKLEKDEIEKLDDMGYFGYSFSSSGTLFVWMKNEKGEYEALEILGGDFLNELLGRYPHHELLGRKLNKPLREVIKSGN